ncbi:dihydrodipicolinate synthase family protein [Saccharopolyspora sp. NFXS83]|uniref:dihydrodipicolinate synthase family protein n=1 Tax=Saccharopolyspora sp. NFXS83 TaxID=2993560 RepID=UPI00224B2EA0|nr:dihydrodipicolinate synthase family protein [Saccharopolyspora sp. NFXS83]MCX2729426.1 dihydrodipicolinate synthase family protein [Saccharopolyspora sp. NFXS83]
MKFDEVWRRLADVIAITPTPFTADDTVDVPTTERVVARLLDGGVRVLTVNGNTGEFYTLSAAEARGLVDLTAAAAGPETLLIVGVGFDAATAIESARYAQDRGAAGVMVHQPVHPYVSRQGWVDYHRTIASAVPDLAVLPYVRTPRIEAADFMALADACPNVLAVKYAVPDPARFASVARVAGTDRFTWIAGLAELSAPGYAAVGATGFTSGLASVAPELSLRMYDALSAGDFPAAMRVWDLVREFEELRLADSSAENVSVIKEALHQIGFGRPDVRPPASLLDSATRGRVSKILATWGVR